MNNNTAHNTWTIDKRHFFSLSSNTFIQCKPESEEFCLDRLVLCVLVFRVRKVNFVLFFLFFCVHKLKYTFYAGHFLPVNAVHAWILHFVVHFLFLLHFPFGRTNSCGVFIYVSRLNVDDAKRQLKSKILQQIEREK